MKNLVRHILAVTLIASALSLLIAGPVFAQAPPPARDRVKDMVSIGGVRSNQLVGYGIVVGLNQTGDGSVAATRQTMQSLLQRFGMSIPDINGIDAKQGQTILNAQVPLAEMFGYATAIRSLSKGRASYSMEPLTFEQVPNSVLTQILETAAKKPAART